MKKTLIAILVLIMALGLVSCSDKDKESQESSQSESEVKLTAAQIYENQLQALMNKESAEKAEVTDEGLLAPAQNTEKLWGYINIKGEWVIEPEYMMASSFSEGYAVVLDQYYEYMIIDKTGNEVFSSYDNTRDLAAVSYFNGGMIPVTLNTGYSQKYLYLDTSFTDSFSARILPSKRYYQNYYYFGFASQFKNGLALVMRLKNSDIDSGDRNGPESAYIINTSGSLIASLPEGLDPAEDGFDDQGNVIVMNTSGLYGLCDDAGNQLVECKYRRIIHCEGSLYLVCNDSGFWGFINDADETVVDYTYQKAYPFSDGLAAVYNGTAWGFLNEKGEIAIDFIFENVYALNDSDLESDLNSAVFKDGYGAVYSDNHWALIDKKGKPVFAINTSAYDDPTECPFQHMENGYLSYMYKDENTWGCALVNTKGQSVLSVNKNHRLLTIGHFK